MQKFQDSCQIHQKIGIAVECMKSNEYDYSILCESCLAEKANNKHIFLLKDAELVFKQFRSQFQNEIEEEQNWKTSFLKNIEGIVQKLQNHFSQKFDQLNNQLNERLKFSTTIFDLGIQQNGEQENKNGNLNIRNFAEQLIEELSRCDVVKKKLQEQDVIEFNNQIQNEIFKLQQSEIFNECLELLTQIDYKKRLNFLEKSEMNVEQYKGNIQRTPKLDLICNEHDKEIIIFDLSEQQQRERRARCVECDPCIFTSLTKCQSMWSNYEKQQSEIMFQFYQSRKSQIGIITQQLLYLKSSFIEKINVIVLQLNGIMSQTELEIFQNLSVLNKDWNTMTLNEVLNIAEILSKPDKMKLNLMQIEIKYKQENLNIDSIFQNSIEEINNQITQLNLYFINKLSDNKNNSYGSPQNSDRKKQNSIDKRQIQTNEQKSDQKVKKVNNHIKQLEEWRIHQLKWSDKYIDYQEFFTKKQAEWCNAIAFNKEGNIMLAASIFSIKIFDFLKGRIVQTYQANKHKGDINCLLFSNKNNQFISGSDDNNIIIWTQVEKNKWDSTVLEGHKGWVLCLLWTKDDQVIISGSRDHTIKIWIKDQDTFECKQTLTNHSDSVYGLSLNKSETQMVSCSQDKSIIVWDIKENFQLVKNEVIEQNTYGYRILFINDSQFLWQPYNQNVEIFTYNSQLSCFRKSSKHNIQQELADDDYQYFPSQFLTSKGVFANIHNKFVYIIKQLNEEEFEILQKIEFNDYRQFGAFTDDGEYLVTWDYTKSEFQIRKNVGTSRNQW